MAVQNQSPGFFVGNQLKDLGIKLGFWLKLDLEFREKLQ